MAGFFDTKIEFLKGIGPQKATLINKELEIFTFGDLIQHYPFRYEDRTKFYSLSELDDSLPNVQVKGKIKRFELVGGGRKKRLVGHFTDGTSSIELVWFQGISWITNKIKPGVEYVVYGKPTRFGSKINITHPEMEVLTAKNEQAAYLSPVYHTSEKLKKKFIDSRAISKYQKSLLVNAVNHIRETLPSEIIQEYKLMDKKRAVVFIHFPNDNKVLQLAQYRLKFEELFFVQLKLLKMKVARMDKFRGAVFNDSSLVTEFYNNHLPFELTNAQKRVIKEVYRDLRSGQQMNRLVQGDVGSGKTIVAFICGLLAISSDAQVALMAPTEILAEQHFNGLKVFCDALGLNIRRLTGSSKKADRNEIHAALEDGSLNVLVGTHALLEEKVKFKNLGLAIIDEQHRFGVAQRAKLWQKNKEVFPHVLVMTATPIPRTLAMTLYGDLDISVIDELPAGRKPIKTIHFYDTNRLKAFGFIAEQIKLGRQVYIVYPLIEESEKLDYKDLMDGYESISRAFPKIPIGILHGRMKPQDKDFEMKRFVKGETKIMVATTVIEVGVNVPNATVMVIENSEKFGLSQLHQLRGRVGRGADQSYCILMSDFKLSKEAKIRIETMVRTNDGFEIAETDLQLRGPGDIMGTMQSGVADLLVSDLAKDGPILQIARECAKKVLDEDPELTTEKYRPIKIQLDNLKKSTVNWSRIS
ncbi:MAG: ATP-dependent DNA helicase RecG [bacterium]|nr:ATP-dependent DNA helicase RecG [bacterium]